MISATENSNKFQKTRFWKEKSVEDVVTQATLVPIENMQFSRCGILGKYRDNIDPDLLWNIPSSVKYEIQPCANLFRQVI